MPPPDLILSVLEVFRTEFSRPAWDKAVVLVLGTLLARGRRTVTAALRQMGMQDETNFSKYHHLFNRDQWSCRCLAPRLLGGLIGVFGLIGVELIFVIDETLERRWGPKITKRGHYRDSRASSKTRSVAASGLRWIVLALVVTPPWTSRSWALPILSVPSPTPAVSARLGRRHKTIATWARQMIACLRRWLSEADVTVVGDQAYSVIDLGTACRRRAVRLIAPLRLDARLFDPPPARTPGTPGRPRKVGRRQPKLEAILHDPSTTWQDVTLRWYDGTPRLLQVASGTALWYHTGHKPLPIRWALTHDPRGQLEPRAYFTTRPDDEPAQVLQAFLKRWTIETTFEESRAHLGIETQRQWSDLATERETPCLLGLYSVVTWIGHLLQRAEGLPIRAASWYPKTQTTFSDVLAAVRRHCWSVLDIRTSPHDPACVVIPRDQLDRLLNAVYYAH